MIESNNPDFKAALKEFDAKNYDKVEKICSRILSKNSKDDQALALKGLNFYFQKKPEEAEKSLKEALKANIKSPVAWHFYAIYHKEKGDYVKAMSSYNNALKYHPTNFKIMQDLSYMKLYLRQYESFTEKCRECVDNQPGNLINWVSLAFGYALTKDYRSALSVLNSVETLGKETLKKNELHEIRIFNAMLQIKDGKYEEAMNYLIHFKNEFIDKPMIYEMIIQNAIKAKKINIGLDYCTKALNLNNENINLIIYYFTMKINDNDFQPKTYNDLLNIPENYKFLDKMKEVLSELRNNYPKSKVLYNLDLSFAQKDEFKQKFEDYFIRQIEITIPSFFINIKFIYKLQPHKIPIIQQILDKYLTNVKDNSKVNDNLNLPIHKSWLYFYAAQHYLFLAELEQAIEYINSALDITPSVVEFYMVAAKIFKHSYMRNLWIDAFDKGRKLEVQDKYLMSKMLKIYLRTGKIDRHMELINRYVSHPLIEENAKYTEPLWYLNECGCAYLNNKNIILSHYCFKNILNSILNIIKDQVDLYNFSFRRYMLKDLYHSIVFHDDIAQNKYLIKALIKIDLIYNYLKSNETNKDLEEKFKKEYEKMKTDFQVQEYQYKDIPELIKIIEEDFYKILLRLQKISKDDEIQYLCVKYFLKKEKLLMAIKSIKYLSKNKNSFYYIESVNLLNKYSEEKKDKLKGKEIIVELTNEYIKDKNEIVEYKEENKFNEIKNKLYQKNVFDLNDNKKIILELIESIDKVELRKLSGEELNNLITSTSIYLDPDGVQDVRNMLNLKMRLFGIDKIKVKRNLGFFENKKFNQKNIMELIKKNN